MDQIQQQLLALTKQVAITNELLSAQANGNTKRSYTKREREPQPDVTLDSSKKRDATPWDIFRKEYSEKHNIGYWEVGKCEQAREEYKVWKTIHYAKKFKPLADNIKTSEPSLLINNNDDRIKYKSITQKIRIADDDDYEQLSPEDERWMKDIILRVRPDEKITNVYVVKH